MGGFRPIALNLSHLVALDAPGLIHRTTIAGLALIILYGGFVELVVFVLNYCRRKFSFFKRESENVFKCYICQNRILK